MAYWETGQTITATKLNATTLIGADIADIATVIDVAATDEVPAGIIDGWNAGLSASVIDNANLTTAKGASIIDNANLTAAKGASIIDNANLTAAKAASVFGHANLTVARLDAILAHGNLAIQKGQTIIDAMSDKTKPTTTSRVLFLGDDWNDNKISSRDNAATTATGLTSMAKTFRPTWTAVSGTWSAPAGKLTKTVAAAEDYITAPCTQNVGTWKFKGQVGQSTGVHRIGICPIYVNSSSTYRYMLYVDASALILDLTGVGNLITSAWTPDTNVHSLKITRDISSNWEIFDNDVSKGTATNSSITTTTVVAFYDRTTTTASAANDLEVY